MRIAVASGKGGTGKTTIATSLALSLAVELTPPPLFLDCDVEAPDAHLFLQPALECHSPVEIQIPVIDEARCTHCGKCAEVCVYHALADLGMTTLVFPQLCHGCGSCVAVCPEGAIREQPYRLGQVDEGPACSGIVFGRGLLDVGAPLAVPVIRRLRSTVVADPGQTVILDCPPGASCPVVAAMRDADYLLLVTEPTPFGLHDLRQAAQVARELGIPAGVIVNRENGSYPELDRFCAQNRLPVLLRIPFERAIAEGVARGENLVEIHPEYGDRFRQMFHAIETDSRRFLQTKGV